VPLGLCILGKGMTSCLIGPHRTPIYVILPVHITLRPMQTGRSIQTGQLRQMQNAFKNRLNKIRMTTDQDGLL